MNGGMIVDPQGDQRVKMRLSGFVQPFNWSLLVFWIEDVRNHWTLRT
jgi:hypothetical protein